MSTSRVGLALVVLATIAGVGWLVQRAPTRQPGPMRISIGRDTTYLTTPLTADGRVDYAAAWRLEHSAGVAAKNNGAPLVYAALGRDVSQFTNEERAGLTYFEPSFAPFEEWAGERENLFPGTRESVVDGTNAHFQRTVKALESGEEDEVITNWLDEVGPSLDAVVAGMARGRFLVPDVARRIAVDGSAPTPESAYGSEGGICEGLGRRALQRARQEDFAGAGADLRAALQLVAGLRSLSMDEEAREAAAAERAVWRRARQIVRRAEGGVESAKLQPFLDELRHGRDAVAPSARLADLLRWLRVGVLAEFGMLLRSVDADLEKERRSGSWTPHRSIDVDRIARTINRGFDAFEEELGTAGSWPDRRSRLLVAIEKAKVKQGDISAREITHLLGIDDDARIELLWIARVAASGSVLRGLTDRLLACIADGDRTLVELAAVAYASANGKDPATSADLSPEFFETPWRDALTDSPVNFRRDAERHLVAEGPVVDFLNQLDAGIGDGTSSNK